MNKTYSTQEAATVIGASHPTIRRWCHVHDIGTVETEVLGRRISGRGLRRLTERDLDRLRAVADETAKARVGRPRGAQSGTKNKNS